MMDTKRIPGGDDQNRSFRWTVGRTGSPVHRADAPSLKNFGLECANGGDMAAILRRVEEAGVAVHSLAFADAFE